LDPQNSEKKAQVIELETTLAFRYKLLIVLAVIVILAGIFYALLETKFKLKTINVEGNTWYTSEEIIEALQTTKADNYSLFFKIHYIFADKPEMPFIDTISIHFSGLDTITIKVYEKNIVGCVYEMGDYLYFDKDGYIISSRSEQTNNVPQIEGLEYTMLTVGKKLEVQDDDIYDTILAVTQLIDKYELLIDTIEFDDSLAITLYCNDGNQVYLGNQTSYDDMIMALPNILSAAEQKTATYWIDMSGFSSENTTIPAEFIENSMDDEKEDEGTGEESDIDDTDDDTETSDEPADEVYN
jgi:cell division protein FtsQ